MHLPHWIRDWQSNRIANSNSFITQATDFYGHNDMDMVRMPFLHFGLESSVVLILLLR
jgi:hypothetical protein